jgi:hypothetical protein
MQFFKELVKQCIYTSFVSPKITTVPFFNAIYKNHHYSDYLENYVVRGMIEKKTTFLYKMPLILYFFMLDEPLVKTKKFEILKDVENYDVHVS